MYKFVCILNSITDDLEYFIAKVVVNLMLTEVLSPLTIQFCKKRHETVKKFIQHTALQNLIYA